MTCVFAFVLYNEQNDGVWSSDGSPGTDEPAGAVPVEVNQGLFTVELGDAGAGMVSIPPLAFHAYELWLRTWVSTNGTAFEHLQPDVRVRSPDFAHFNTGNLIVVDDDGHADFSSLQEAVDFASQTPAYDSILVMPGYYPGPVVLPDYGKHLFIRGASQHWNAWIESTNGPAFLPGIDTRVCLENLTLRGAPALTDAGLADDDWCDVEIRQCALLGAGTEPALAMSASSSLTLSDCYIGNGDSGSAVELGGSVEVQATGLRVRVAAGPAIRATGSARMRLESCNIESEEGLSLLAEDASSYSTFNLCRFERGVVVTNGSFGAWFTDCYMGPTLGLYSMFHNNVTLAGCEFGYEPGMNRVRIVDGNPHVRIKNGYLHGWEVEVTGSDLWADGWPVLNLSGPGEVLIWNSEIWGGEGGTEAGVRLALAPDSGLAIIQGSTIGGDGPALECVSGNLQCKNSWLVSVTNTAVTLDGTNVTARFNHCVLSSLGGDVGVANTNPVVVLSGATGATPVPTLLSCSLEPSDGAAHAIGLGGGATTGNVRMANCTLTAEIDPRLGKVPPQSQDAYGNVVMPRQP